MEKAPRGYMGTFSILLRIVQLLHLTIFSFLLLFPTLALKWAKITELNSVPIVVVPIEAQNIIRLPIVVEPNEAQNQWRP
jgi:hypothetical protein